MLTPIHGSTMTVIVSRFLVVIYLFFITGLGNIDLGINIVNNILYFLYKGLSVSSSRVIHRLDRFKPYIKIKSIIYKEE